MKEKKNLAFPSWERIEKESTEQYLSFLFRRQLCDNLFVTIERRKSIWARKGGSDYLHFSFGPGTGPAILSTTHPSTKEGYEKGVDEIISLAGILSVIFSEFAKNVEIEKGEEENV